MNTSGIRYFALSLVFILITGFIFIPIGIITVISFSKGHTVPVGFQTFTWTHYQQLWDPLYLSVFIYSTRVAFFTTLICLLIGYPFAYLVAHAKKQTKLLLLIGMLIPFWTNSLLRSYAMMALLKRHGLINQTLMSLHLIHNPLNLLYSPLAVYLGLVYTLFPFMVLPIYAQLERMDMKLIEAAKDLGACGLRRFISIVWPLSLPGVLTGSLLVFLPAMTLFYVPTLLGGAKSLLLGNVIQSAFLELGNWPLGCAMGLSFVVLMSLLLASGWRYFKQGEQEWL